jgi:hypothetical protein
VVAVSLVSDHSIAGRVVGDLVAVVSGVTRGRRNRLVVVDLRRHQRIWSHCRYGLWLYDFEI